MTKKQKRVKKIIDSLKEYINTYDTQPDYLNYSEEIIINDMLYGIGIALNNKYKYYNGYEKFKKFLLKNFLQK